MRKTEKTSERKIFTVKELIEELSKYPPSYPVGIATLAGYTESLKISEDKLLKNICIEIE